MGTRDVMVYIEAGVRGNCAAVEEEEIVLLGVLYAYNYLLRKLVICRESKWKLSCSATSYCCVSLLPATCAGYANVRIGGIRVRLVGTMIHAE